MTDTFWCEAAWLGGATATQRVLITVQHGLISSIQVGVGCPPNAVRLTGLTIPGVANAHSHAFHRALRSRTHHGEGTFWTWRDQMYAVAERLDPDLYHDLAIAVFGEMALAGVTCVGEFHYLHHHLGGTPYSNPNAMSEALIDAAGVVGIRFTMLDTCYLEGAPGQALNPLQTRFSDGSFHQWAERVSGYSLPNFARLGGAAHSVRAVPPDVLRSMAEWGRSNEAVLHAHVSEQPAENEQCRAAYGLTPVGVLAREGVLAPNFTAVHATHLTPDDIALLGANETNICMCPTTERDLADGVGPAAALRAANAALCVGSDSHAVIDLFEEARAIELDERLVTLRRGNHRAVALLEAATVKIGRAHV